MPIVRRREGRTSRYGLRARRLEETALTCRFFCSGAAVVLMPTPISSNLALEVRRQAVEGTLRVRPTVDLLQGGRPARRRVEELRLRGELDLGAVDKLVERVDIVLVSRHHVLEGRVFGDRAAHRIDVVRLERRLAKVLFAGRPLQKEPRRALVLRLGVHPQRPYPEIGRER